MSDLIDRQAAIDEVHKEFDECLVWDESGECTADEVERILESLPSAQPEQRWIPVSDRLPKYDGEMYLVTDYCEQINRRRIHVSYCYVNREGFWSDVPIGYKVIAWMPLPEPWKEGEADGN